MTLFAIAALLSYFVKGLCGFANMLVFGSILSFSADNIDISPIGLISGVLCGLYGVAVLLAAYMSRVTNLI